MDRVVKYLIGKRKKHKNLGEQPGNTIVTTTTLQNGVKKSKNRRRIWKKKKQIKQGDRTVQFSPTRKVRKTEVSGDVKVQTSSDSRTVSVRHNNVTVSINHKTPQTSQGNKKNLAKKQRWRNMKWRKGKKTKPDSSTSTTAPQPMVPKKREEFSSNWKKLAAALQTHKETQTNSKTSPKSAKKRKLGRKESPRKRTKLTREDKGQGASEQNAHPDLWFVDDLDVEDIEVTLGPEVAAAARREKGLAHRPAVSLVRPDSFDGLTRAVGMDCEMVGTGHRGSKSALARVSIVNQFGKCVYDKFVKPKEKVTDYRTFVSGIRPKDLKKGESFKSVQKEVAGILKGRILVGHALHNDMKALQITHPKHLTRDTANFPPFRSLAQGNNTPSLKKLAAGVLHLQIQKGEHCSIQDAQVAMRLYTLHKKEWEAFCRPGASNKGTPHNPQERQDRV